MKCNNEIMMIVMGDDDLFTTYYIYDGYINQKHTTNTKDEILSSDFKYTLPIGKTFDDMLFNNMVPIFCMRFYAHNGKYETFASIYVETEETFMLKLYGENKLLMYQKDGVLSYEKVYIGENLKYIDTL